MSKNLPGPCSVRQLMYVESEADVTLYGGAAGSGKSEIGVIDFLKYTDIPNFIGVITRRTTPQLTGPGGMLTKCKRVFGQAYAPDEYTWRAKDGKFVFHKSGAEIYLKHFENDQADVNWQGSEANLFYVDEGTQFTQHMIQYIMSRMRNPSCPDVKPHLKITCNPDADHFLRKWVEPYLNEDGTPNREKDGLIRYFTFQDGDFIWGDSTEELVQKYGVDADDCLSFTFISATVKDNPVMSKVNPKYVSWLRGLKGVERARLLEGNWFIREEASSYFNRNWVTEVHHVDEEDVWYTVRAFDFAGTLVSDLNPSPDYTTSVRMRKMKNGDYVIDDIRRCRIRHGQWESFVLECYEDDPFGVEYIIPQDPGPAAQRATQLFCRRLAELGIATKKEKTNKSKLDRFRPFASVAENGGVFVLSNCGWDKENDIKSSNDFYYKELETFTGERKRGESGHDDLVDSTSTAFTALASKTTSLSGISKNLIDINTKFAVGNPFRGMSAFGA